MKDLKHLIFFEVLLQQANNQLVQQAVATLQELEPAGVGGGPGADRPGL